MDDLEYLRRAAADPLNTRFEALPLLRAVLSLVDRVEALESKPARKPRARKTDGDR